MKKYFVSVEYTKRNGDADYCNIVLNADFSCASVFDIENSIKIKIEEHIFETVYTFKVLTMCIL